MGIKVRPSPLPIHKHVWRLEDTRITLGVLQNLTKLLGDHAPGCCREQKIDNYFGRKIAIDASMHIYQFLVRLQSLQSHVFLTYVAFNALFDFTMIVDG